MDYRKDEFKKFANSMGVNSMLLHDVQSHMDGPNSMTPYIIEESEMRGVQLDVFSRLMKDRTIFLGTGINDQVANIVVAQLLFLDSVDSETDINMYVASPGGSVYAGYGIIDTMHFVNCEIATTNLYLAASMGAMILSQGTKGKRSSLKMARTMIHQPLGGAQGQASDIEISANQIKIIKEELYEMLADSTNKTIDEIKRDADRDFWMRSHEALEYGIIDKVVKKRPKK